MCISYQNRSLLSILAVCTAKKPQGSDTLRLFALEVTDGFCHATNTINTATSRWVSSDKVFFQGSVGQRHYIIEAQQKIKLTLSLVFGAIAIILLLIFLRICAKGTSNIQRAGGAARNFFVSLSQNSHA